MSQFGISNSKLNEFYFIFCKENKNYSYDSVLKQIPLLIYKDYLLHLNHYLFIFVFSF